MNHQSSAAVLAALALIGGATASCTAATPPAAPTTVAAVPVASAAIVGSDGTGKGRAWLIATGGRWELRLEAQGLPAGIHGVHLHMAGRCDAPAFTTAGAHLNPHAKAHGSLNPQGPHLGDMPNLTVGADGKGTLAVSLTGAATDLEPALFDGDGTAIVIHATADDYLTDPSGNSGSRIACGVLSR